MDMFKCENIKRVDKYQLTVGRASLDNNRERRRGNEQDKKRQDQCQGYNPVPQPFITMYKQDRSYGIERK